MVRGRFCMKRCGPSRHRLRDASAVLEILLVTQKRLFQHYLGHVDRTGHCLFSEGKADFAAGLPHGDRCVEFLRYGVLPDLRAPCRLLVLAGPEHGRTISIAEVWRLTVRLLRRSEDI